VRTPASRQPTPIRLIGIVDEPLDVAAIEAAVRDREAGGVSVFVGTVREHDTGRGVTGLSYTAHPTATDVMTQIANDIETLHEVIALAAVHRIGDLAVGDIAVVVAVSAAHRGQAIDACHDLIDTLKARAPIWKHQLFADGSDEWVGTP
jgi:molybdopterin synthase catalytic subunit